MEDVVAEDQVKLRRPEGEGLVVPHYEADIRGQVGIVPPGPGDPLPVGVNSDHLGARPLLERLGGDEP